jgi:ubiquinone/menaquinone biosynthesis C-methylase UbiE
VTSSLAVHHIPVEERPETLREMFRVLRPGGRLLIAEFRPPTNRLLARPAGALAGPAMRYDPAALVARLIPDAGFHIEAEGDLWPMLHYVRVVRPAGTPREAG